MATDPNFVPVFGPNGAVMNAPTMTPEMRAKFGEAGKIPPHAEVLRGIRLLGLMAVVSFLIMSYADFLKQFLLEYPMWASVVTASFAVIALLCLMRFGVDLLRRWDFVGAERRTLLMPAWARVTLLISDFLMGAGFAGLQVNVLTDFAGDRWLITAVSLAVAFFAAMFGWLLRALADELKWKWRAPA